MAKRDAAAVDVRGRQRLEGHEPHVRIHFRVVLREHGSEHVRRRREAVAPELVGDAEDVVVFDVMAVVGEPAAEE